MKASERIYEVLLALYPTDFLKEYREPMRQLFCDQLKVANSHPKLVRLWLRTVADLVKSLAVEHLTTKTPRFSEEARCAIFLAREEASSLESNAIMVQHLLMGILCGQSDLVSALFTERIVREITDVVESKPKRHPTPIENLPLDDACRSVVRRAVERASQSGRSTVSAWHLLWGIVQERESATALLLGRYGFDRYTVEIAERSH